MTERILVCADVHLSDFPPRCRATETDWIASQLDTLLHVREIARKEGACFIYVCGDLFHKPRVSPRLEARVISLMQMDCNDDQVPYWWAIPGQHDMPGHSMEAMEDSSYNVLIKSGILGQLTARPAYASVPFGVDLLETLATTKSQVAFAHTMLWEVEPFPGAPKHGNVDALDKALKSPLNCCKFLFAGDNHIPFEYEGDNITIVNCGSLTRRTADQIDHKPSVIIVEGSRKTTYKYERIYLDTSKDKFVVPESVQRKTADEKKAELQAFIDTLGDASLEKDLDIEHVLSVVYEQKSTTDNVKKLIRGVRNDITK